MFEDFEWKILCDRLTGVEFVDFLNIPIESLLEASEEFGWITEENAEDLLDFVGLRKDNNNE